MKQESDRDLQELRRLRAIVLGVGHPRSAAVIRSLGKAGIAVDGVDYKPDGQAWRSRYIRNKHLISVDDESTLEFLEVQGRLEGGLIFTTDDHYLFLVAKNHARLAQHFTLTAPPWDVVEKLMDRQQAYTIAREVGVRIPQSYAASDLEELEQIVSELDFKEHSYILKTPVWSLAADPATQRFSKVAGDAASMLETCYELHSRIGEYPLIEEVVPGESNECVGVSMVVDRNHEPVICYCVKRLKLSLYSYTGVMAHTL